MKLLTYIVVSSLIIGFYSFAWSQGTHHDWQTGNSYRWQKTGSDTTVYGSNLKTGKNWNTHIDNNGSMRGQDSKGNFWNYNQQSGTYMNYGTGKICTGKGYGRICN